MKSNSKEADRIQDPPKVAVKMANAVFVLGILFSILVIIYAIYRIYNPIYDAHLGNIHTRKYYLFCILLGGTFATLFGLGLRLKNSLKVNLSVLFVTTGISVCTFETYLEILRRQMLKQTNCIYYKFDSTLSLPKQEIAKDMGIPYDTRTKLEVLQDLRKDGVEAYPNVGPRSISTNKGTIYTLGGISNITTIFGNESGYFPIIEFDEHGFNNPKGLYKKNRVDIVLTGDSMTEGFSVHSNENIGAVLRKSGFNVISVGKGGNDSLTELAAIKEYAEPLRPKIVFWVYYVNDLDHLGSEMDSPLLRKYLYEDNFSQNLISRQDEIDSVLMHYANQAILEREKAKKRERGEIINHWSKRILRLRNLRKRLNLVPETVSDEVFFNILQKAKKMVSRWGGKMYFVYLPAFSRYSRGIEDIDREFVMRTVTELGIPVIDIHTEAFALHPDPLSFFPFRCGGHYNAEGYKLVAESISKRLEADGIIPLNSRN